MVGFIFKFGLKKGQCQVKLGRIRSNFRIQNFVTKHAYRNQFCLSIPKMLFIFTQGNYKCQKLHVKKVTPSPLPVFFYHCIAKNNDIAFKFVMCVLCRQAYNIYSGFLDNSKIFDFICIFLKNCNFEFRGSKLEKAKIRDSHFLERSILRFLTLLDCVSF